jgi:hypothetical protein
MIRKAERMIPIGIVSSKSRSAVGLFIGPVVLAIASTLLKARVSGSARDNEAKSRAE